MEAIHAPVPRDQPQEQPKLKKVSPYVASETNRILGYRLWFRVKHEHVSPADAWGEVFPNSKSRGDNAKNQANRFLKWYEETYPPTFDQVANALGLTPYMIMKNIRLMMRATLWKWSEADKKEVNTGRPDLKMRAMGHDRLMKLVEKSERWRKQFLEQEANRPTQLNTPPEHATVEEWEAWRDKQDTIAKIERDRKAATEARNRRLQEEGRQIPPPRVNGAHT